MDWPQAFAICLLLASKNILRSINLSKFSGRGEKKKVKSPDKTVMGKSTLAWLVLANCS